MPQRCSFCGKTKRQHQGPCIDPMLKPIYENSKDCWVRPTLPRSVPASHSIPLGNPRRMASDERSV
jgi:hypothetical protein